MYFIQKVQLTACVILMLVCVQSTWAQSPNWLFKNGTEGYNMFRIPAIVATNSGKLLAFCEGRQSLRDHGNIDIVMKTSLDGGNTWSALKVIWNEGKHTCGNPAPVVDRKSGAVLVPVTLDNDKVFVLRSFNEGDSWEQPMDITASVKMSDWHWYATGPVHSIQISNGNYKGRIVVPCNHTVKEVKAHISHTIYSDDAGLTWKRGGTVPNEGTDECTVAELNNGKLLLNMRNTDRALPNRKVSISSNGGITWSEAKFDTALVEPVCQGSLLRYNERTLIFINPRHTRQRKNLTLSISHNEGNTWDKRVTIFSQLAAYNDAVVLPNGNVLCIYETGKVLPYGGIVCTYINKERIETK